MSDGILGDAIDSFTLFYDGTNYLAQLGQVYG